MLYLCKRNHLNIITMAKVFILPDGFEAPEFNWEDIEQYKKDCAEHTQRIKQWCVERNPNQVNVGVIIKFPVADGYAEYMVAATKPVQLIHLPYWDAWQSETAELMTANAIQQKVDQQVAMEKLFAPRV
jgi:hypothetical protein